MKSIRNILLSVWLLTVSSAVAQNNIDIYVNYSDQNEFIEIVNSSNQVSRPNDLDFNPLETNGPMELWVINEGTENTGGSTVTITNAGDSASQQSTYKKDGNAWHFMSLPTGMAFGDNGRWANSPGVFDANHNGGSPFTGPALWSADLDTYAITPPGGNGSHLDMLHQSPHSMGIAHEAGNVYWVFDGHNQTVVRYDFGHDHGPGNHDHSDGKVHFYDQVSVLRNPALPSHLVYDKDRDHVYVVDGGNQRIIRIDASTSTKVNDLPFNNEFLAERWSVDADFEIIVDSGLVAPCGIEVYDNRLLVSDNGTDEIIVYDILAEPVTEVGRIPLTYADPDIRGLVVGPDENIWFTDYASNTVYKLDNPAEPTVGITASAPAGVKVSVYPNPAQNLITVAEIPLGPGQTGTVEITNVNGKIVYESPVSHSHEVVDISLLPHGLYVVKITAGKGVQAAKFLKE